MFRVRKLPEALPRKRGTSVPQLPSNKYYVSLHFGFLYEHEMDKFSMQLLLIVGHEKSS